MRHIHWYCVLTTIVALSQPVNVLGFAEKEAPVRLVNHRDLNGNLVWPQKSRRSVVQTMARSARPDRSIFQRDQWGANAARIRAQESARLLWEVQAPVLEQGERRLGYETTVSGLSAILTYRFMHDRLRETKYLFDVPYDETAEHLLAHYETVKTWIARSYGEPASEAYLWLDTLYQYAPKLWGKAVMRGHLTVVAEWQVQGTSITLILNGGNEDDVGLLAQFVRVDAPSPTQMVSLPSFLFGL